ncbi:MAG TPA: RNA-binding cell elongation regulator Jag/EloR [Pleomorphomonadaceae bacterium]|nr:RNA-binding cell elongation regulator Jag/EloR [Pleomorphomonadaceae bacterium]
MTFKEFTGKNVEEAIRAAMREFASDLADLDIEILSQGSRGILGVGGDEARILAAPKSAVAEATSLRSEEPPAPAHAANAGEGVEFAESASEPASDGGFAIPDGGADALTDAMADAMADAAEAPTARPRGRGRGRDAVPRREPRAPRDRGERPAAQPRDGDGRPEPRPFVPAKPMEELSESERLTLEEAKAVLEELLRLMELQGSVEVLMGTEAAKLNVVGTDLGVLIGRRGEKLASLQHIVNLIVARREGQLNRIMVDVENYRGRREDQLRDVADRAAQRVAQSGKIIQLEAMPAMERRIVHLALSEHATVRTQSVGVEPNRRVVILPATKVE